MCAKEKTWNRINQSFHIYTISWKINRSSTYTCATFQGHSLSISDLMSKFENSLLKYLKSGSVPKFSRDWLNEQSRFTHFRFWFDQYIQHNILISFRIPILFIFISFKSYDTVPDASLMCRDNRQIGLFSKTALLINVFVISVFSTHLSLLGEILYATSCMCLVYRLQLPCVANSGIFKR